MALFSRIFERLVEIREIGAAHLQQEVAAIAAEAAEDGMPLGRITGLREHARIRLLHAQRILDHRAEYLAGLGGATDLLTPALVAGLRFEYGAPNLTGVQVGTYLTAIRDRSRDLLLAANGAVPAEIAAMLSNGPEERYNGDELQAALAQHPQHEVVEDSPAVQAMLTAADALSSLLVTGS